MDISISENFDVIDHGRSIPPTNIKFYDLQQDCSSVPTTLSESDCNLLLHDLKDLTAEESKLISQSDSLLTDLSIQVGCMSVSD